MKKIFLIFISIIAFIPNVYGMKFHLGEKTDKIYFTNGVQTYSGSVYKFLREDNKFVYCVKPYTDIKSNTEYAEYNYNDPIFGLSDETLNKINLYAYFGYKYPGHDSIKWYEVTQYLIWRELDVTEIYFVDVNYDDEILEIENLVNDYYKEPSIDKNLEYSSNRSYEIIDTNNVLNNYEIEYTNIDAYIDNNTLKINTTDDGIYEIKLIKKSPIKSDYELYYLSGYQSFLYPGAIGDIKINITIEVNSGSITVNKYDSEGNIREEAKIEGAKYGLYSGDELINEIIINSEGVGYLDNIELGEYYLKEIEAGIGYNLDTNIYQISITKDNKDIVINSYESVIKGEVIINKYYGDDELEDGAVFEIYDSSDNLVDTITTKNGTVNKTLDYGSYTIVQKEGKEGYKFIDDFKIFIEEEIQYLFNLYDEVLIVDVPNTLKIDYIRYISPILILVGILLIVYAKKTTLG